MSREPRGMVLIATFMQLGVAGFLSGASAASAQDTLVVAAQNPPVWGDSLVLVEELRIGRLDGPEEYTLGYVSALAPGPDGSVYVADSQVPAIRKYGSDGDWLRNIGREGEGPGEYRMPQGLAYLPGDSLRLYDYRNRRVTVYDPRDEYAHSFPTHSGLLSADLFVVDTTGAVWVKGVDHSGDPLPENAPWPFIWIRYAPNGSVRDTMPIPPADQVGGSWVISGYGGYFKPFTIETISAVSPHGYLIFARNDEYAIHRRLDDGRLLRIERVVPQVALLPEEKAQWEEWVSYWEEQGRDGPFGPIPDEKPFIRDLFVDGEGRIWVGRYATAVHRPYTPQKRAERLESGVPPFTWRQPLLWDVLDPRGAHLGTVTLPFNTTLAAARGRVIWGIQGGEFREPYVVRFRIQTTR